MQLTCPAGHRWELSGDANAQTLGDETACPVCGVLMPLSSSQAPDNAVTLPPSPQPSAETRAPTIPGYEILGELGRGGMGVVYKARQVQLKRLVALKMILTAEHAGEAARARFHTEAEAVARLQHGNIVQIYEVGEHAGRPFFSMEFVSGGSLEAHLDGTPLPARAAAELVEPLAHAMHYAHQRGVIHRDLKPANVLLQAHGLQSVGLGSPKITDFGLAKQLDTQTGQTQSGSILGTPSYMAPEQAGGKTKDIGPAADIYALGAILYELLTGRPPFRAETPLDTVLQAVSSEPVPPSRLQPKLPRDLETICLKCLEKDPHKRYAFAEDLALELRRFLDGEPIRARPIGIPDRAWRWCKRKPATAALLGLVVAVVLGIFFGLPAVAWREQHLRRDAQRSAESARAAEQLARINQERAELLSRQREADLFSRNVNLAYREVLANNPFAAPGLLDPCPPAFRAWDWHYVKRLSQDERHTILLDHRPKITSLAFHPDGRRLAWVEGGGRVCLFDLTAQKIIHQFQAYPQPPQAGEGSFERGDVAFSPDGKRLAAGGRDHAVLLWDVETGKELPPLRGHTDVVLSVAFSPDGRQLASGGRDKTIRLWDLGGGKPMEFRGHIERVNSLAFTPDGKRLASADWQTVKVWDTASGKSLVTHRVQHAISVAISPDGRWLAVAGGHEATVPVWDLATNRVAAVLRGHANFVLGVAFSPDGRRLASTGWQQSVKVWDVETWQEAYSFRGHMSTVLTAAFSPDGRFLASGDWYGAIKLWDVTTGPDAQTVRLEMPVLAMALAPDGRRLALSLGYGGFVRFWQLDRGEEEVFLPANGFPVHDLAFSPDGKQVATGSSDKGVRLWDATGGKLLHFLGGHAGEVAKVAFSPDGRRLASASLDATVRLWDVATGQALQTLTHPQGVQAVAFSPDGTRLATGGLDGLVHLWDSETAREVQPPRQHYRVSALAFSPYGTQLAAAGESDAGIWVWELAGGELLHLRGHTYGTNSIAFSPDGRRLASAAGDGLVKVWDAGNGQELLNLRLHTNGVNRVLFSPDGWRLITASSDRTVRICDASPMTPERARASLERFDEAWHRQESAQAWRARQWYAALFHVDRLLAAQPDHPQWLRYRALSYAELGQYQKADADLTRLLAKVPGDVDYRALQAVVKLADGDPGPYRAACSALLLATLFDIHSDRGILAMGMASLVPGAVDDPTALVRRGELMVAKAPTSYVARTQYGAALYRAGQSQKAIEQIRKAIELHGQDGIPWDWLFLALAHQKLGQKEEARAWLAKAVEAMGPTFAEAPLDVPGYTGPASGPRLAIRILRKEVEREVLGAK